LSEGLCKKGRQLTAKKDEGNNTKNEAEKERLGGEEDLAQRKPGRRSNKQMQQVKGTKGNAGKNRSFSLRHRLEKNVNTNDASDNQEYGKLCDTQLKYEKWKISAKKLSRGGRK